MELEYGYTISDRYVLRKSLGRGGNGSVYLAFDNRLEKYWAVKACHNLSEYEIYALKQINHFAFPRIVDVISQDNYEFLIMDYIEGETLASYCSHHSASEKQILIWSRKIASALSYLHSMNPSVMYVDCKPSNIMITPSGDIRLIDLGSIFVEDKSSKESVSGTLFYVPSELASSTPTVATDVYSFGMTMYRLLTGSRVEYRNSAGVLMPNKINKHLHKGTVHIIQKCTASSPDMRYHSARDLVKDLEELISTGKLSSAQHISSRTFIVLTELVLAISILLIAAFVTNYCIYIIPVLFVILLEISKSKGSYTYEIIKDIYRSSVPLGIGMLILSLVFGATTKGAYNNERLDISLYDDYNRKLLVKPGATWIVNNDIMLSLNKNELSTDQCTVTISCVSADSNKSYSFKCASAGRSENYNRK